MPICQSCNNLFPNRVFIDGKYSNLQRRKFCLECSPFGLHNTSSSVIVRSSKIDYRICCDCKVEKPLSDFYFADKSHVRLRYNCKSCSNQKTLEWQRELKQQCVDYLGGKCVVCGYDKHASAFDFHHKDPSQKEFQLSHRGSRKLQSLKKELDKCVLLCSNCHRETHSGLHPEHLIVKERL